MTARSNPLAISRAGTSRHGRALRRQWLRAAAALIGGSLCCSAAAAAGAPASADGVLRRAEQAMGGSGLNSIRFSARGTGAAFGQAFEAGGAWPRLTINTFMRVMDYANGAMRQDSARSRAEPSGGGALPLMGTGEQRVSAFVRGTHAWNISGQTPQAVPVLLEARLHDLWTSPHGVLLAARRNKATVDFRQEAGRSMAVVSFTEPGVMKASAFISEDGLVERVEAVMPHPVTGDTLVVSHFDNYRQQGAVRFPMRIRQSHVGQPTLELTVDEVEINSDVSIDVPEPVRGFVERVDSQVLAEGVWFLGGGSHNSVLIELKNHLVLVEAPLYDGRSAAVFAHARELAPGKPIHTVINSHHHFDHAGGLRTAAAEGAVLLVAAPARRYLEKALANPNKVKPDLLARSGKRVKMIGYTGLAALSDGTRQIQIHSIENSVHAKGFTLIYLPRERLLIEADAFTPGAPDSPPPAKPNDNHLNLADNIERLKLSVDRIVPLHGKVVPVAELYRMIGQHPRSR